MKYAAVVAALAIGGLVGHSMRPKPEIRERVVVQTRTIVEERTAEIEKKALELRAEPERLEETLERFRQTRDPELSAVLGHVHDPEVERMALELARAGDLAGFDLLDRLDIDNPEIRAAILEILRTEPRAEQLAAAIYALHRGVPDPRETEAAVAALSPLASHPDVEVRRRAVVALAEWGSVEPAIRALADPSPDVRCGAAFAIRSPEGVPALAARVADEGEDWAVREVAWRSLARFVLDERTHAVWAAFRDRRDAVHEVGE